MESSCSVDDICLFDSIQSLMQEWLPAEGHSFANSTLLLRGIANGRCVSIFHCNEKVTLVMGKSLRVGNKSFSEGTPSDDIRKALGPPSRSKVHQLFGTLQDTYILENDFPRHNLSMELNIDYDHLKLAENYILYFSQGPLI